MLESVFIILIAVGFVTFGIALFEEWATLLSLIMTLVSILFLLGAWAGSVYIEVPSATYYNEPAIGWICFGLIIINVFGLINSIMTLNVEFKRPR